MIGLDKPPAYDVGQRVLIRDHSGVREATITGYVWQNWADEPVAIVSLDSEGVRRRINQDAIIGPAATEPEVAS